MFDIPIIVNVLAFIESSKYVLLFLGSFFEGSIVMLTSGVLWHAGAVAFWPAYLALLVGDFAADTCWYLVGYFGARRFVQRWGYFINLTPEIMTKVENRFHRHHTTILIVSKLTMGFGFSVATLITAGMLRVSFLRYMLINFFGGLLWVLFLMTVGYWFGNVLTLVPSWVGITLAVFAVLGFLIGLRYTSQKLSRIDW